MVRGEDTLVGIEPLAELVVEYAGYQSLTDIPKGVKLTEEPSCEIAVSMIFIFTLCSDVKLQPVVV